MRRLLWVFLALPLQAQIFSAGVKAGVPLTEAYTATSFGDSRTSSAHQNRYLIGGTAEIHFPLHISFEVDALYRRNGVSATGSTEGRSTINDWQFPFLGKYEFKGGGTRPFVDAGLVYRRLSGSALYYFAFPPSSSTLVATSPNMAGFAAGGGVTLKFWKIRVSPEVRYTHWFDASGTSLNAAMVNGNQADLLAGFTY